MIRNYRYILCNFTKKKRISEWQKYWRIIQGRSTRLKKQLKGRHFLSDAEVIAAAENWLDGQPSEFF